MKKQIRKRLCPIILAALLLFQTGVSSVAYAAGEGLLITEKEKELASEEEREVSGGDALEPEAEDAENGVGTIALEAGGDMWASHSITKFKDGGLTISPLGRVAAGFSYHLLDGQIAFCGKNGAAASNGTAYRLREELKIEGQGGSDEYEMWLRAAAWYSDKCGNTFNQTAYIIAQTFIWCSFDYDNRDVNFIRSAMEFLAQAYGSISSREAANMTDGALWDYLAAVNVSFSFGSYSGSLMEMLQQIEAELWGPINLERYHVYVYDCVTNGAHQPMITLYAGSPDTPETPPPSSGSSMKGSVKLYKLDKWSGNRIAGDAEFTLYEWNGSDFIPSTVYTVIRKDDYYTVSGGEEEGYVYYEEGDPGLGTFRIAETKAPQGYILSESPIDFTLTEDGEEFVFEFVDAHVHGEVVLQKYDDEAEADYEPDSPDGSGRISQGDALLDGAVYGLYAAEDISHPDGVTGVLHHAGDLVQKAVVGRTPKTNAEGLLVDADGVPCYQSGKEPATEDTPGRTAFRQVELGKYYIQEIPTEETAGSTPPYAQAEGYLADTEDHRGGALAKYDVTFSYLDDDPAHGIVARNETAQSDGNNLTMDDSLDGSQDVFSGDFVRKQAVRFVKLDDLENDSEGTPLEGAGFKIYLLSALSGVKSGELAPLNGEAWTKLDMERKEFEAYDFTDEQTAVVYKRGSAEEPVSGEEWTKYDKQWLESTGRRKNEYQVKEMFTDEDGAFTTPELPYGQYILIETTVPKNKVMADPVLITIGRDDPEPQKIRYLENESVQTYIRLQKTDTDPFTEQYDTVLKEGASYRIRLLSDRRAFLKDNDNKAWSLQGGSGRFYENYQLSDKEAIEALAKEENLYLTYLDHNEPAVRRGTEESPFRPVLIPDAAGKIADAYIELDYELPAGTYELEELTAPSGYVVNGAEDALRDTSEEKGYRSYEITDAPQEKVTFEISDDLIYPEGQMGPNKYFNTDEYGNLYIIVQQPNKQQKGILEITKYGEKLAEASRTGKALSAKLPGYGEAGWEYRSLSGTGIWELKDYEFTYEMAPVKDAVFGVFAAEDIYSQQLDPAHVGTDYAGELDQYPVFEKDCMVAELTTDRYGYAYQDNLPIGKYYVKELTAGEGFVLNDRVEYFEISAASQEVNFLWAGMEYLNERQKVSVSAVKQDAGTGEPVPGAVFGLYSKEDIYTYIAEGDVADIPYYRLEDGTYPDYSNQEHIYRFLYDAVENGNGKCYLPSDGRLLIEADTLLETAVTGEDGTAVFEADLPLGEYYVVELEAPEGYTLPEEGSPEGHGGQAEGYGGQAEGRPEESLPSDGPGQARRIGEEAVRAGRARNVDASYGSVYGGQKTRLQVHDGETESLIFTNRQTQHVFTKSDFITGELLDGAILQVWEIEVDRSGNARKDGDGYAVSLVEEWVSDSKEEHYFYEDGEGGMIELTSKEELPEGKELIIKKGHLIDGLKEGRQYLFREIQAPEGYIAYQWADSEVLEANREENLISEEVRFTVRNNNIVAEHDMKNRACQIEVKKTDGSGALLSGARLQIRKAEEAGPVEAEVSGNNADVSGSDVSGNDVSRNDMSGNDAEAGNPVVAEWTTDGRPYYLNDVEPGEYILRELQAPEGYSLAEDIRFTVTGQEKGVIRLSMKDLRNPEPYEPREVRFDVPGDGGGDTGDHYDALLYLALAVAAAAALMLTRIAVFWKRRWHRAKRG